MNTGIEKLENKTETTQSNIGNFYLLLYAFKIGSITFEEFLSRGKEWALKAY